MSELELVVAGRRFPWPGTDVPAGDPGMAAIVPAGEPADDVLARAVPGAVVVTAVPMTDTLKRVDGAGVVRGTADREHHRLVGAPLAAPLGALLAAADARDVPDLLARLAGTLDVVPLPE